MTGFLNNLTLGLDLALGPTTAVTAVAIFRGNELSGSVWEETVADNDGTVTSATEQGEDGFYTNNKAWNFDGSNDRVTAHGVSTAFVNLGS